MGNYELTEFDNKGFPVYRHMDNHEYLLKKESKIWTVSLNFASANLPYEINKFLLIKLLIGKS